MPVPRPDARGRFAPDRFAPMLASAGELPDGPGWASEFKWDGVRAIAHVSPGDHAGDRAGDRAGPGDGARPSGGGRPRRTVQLVSRTGLEVSPRYPELADLPERLAGRRAVLDGEIVAPGQAGTPSFARLQNRINVETPSARLLAEIPVIYYVFDVISLDGAPLLDRPYEQRRALLEGLDLAGPSLAVPPAFLTGVSPADVYQVAAARGLEGVVAKRLRSSYQPGRRSPDWVKKAVLLTQEGIVIGYQPGAGRRAGAVGSLLLAAHDASGALSFIGKVGTGFSEAALAELTARLAALAAPGPAAADVPRDIARAARWTRPELVGEVAFRNWTDDGRMRGPSWRGWRPDRTPDEIRRPAAG